MLLAPFCWSLIGASAPPSGTLLEIKGEAIASEISLSCEAEPAVRGIRVYLPPGYDAQRAKPYPVLYLQDGQNVFGNKGAFLGRGWNMHHVVDELIAAGKIEPLIVVGIPNSGKTRPLEYMGFAAAADALDGAAKPPVASLQCSVFLGQSPRSRAKSYEAFVLEAVLPYVEKRFHARADRAGRAIGGSSFGGGASLALSLRNRDVFGRVIAMSAGHYEKTDPQWQTRPYAMVPHLLKMLGPPRKANAQQRKTPLWLWLDIGLADAHERTFAKQVYRLARGLKQRGYGRRQGFSFVVDKTGEHNEHSWHRRSYQMLPKLFFVGSTEKLARQSNHRLPNQPPTLQRQRPLHQRVNRAASKR